MSAAAMESSKYAVGEPRSYQTLSEPPSGEGKRHAVLVVHGMGQQMPFDTAATVADELRGGGAATVRVVDVGGERLHRVEMRVGDRDVDVYEAYWAPLTEGKITLRDVIGFLRGAGVAGLLKCLTKYRRWMFGGVHELKREYMTPLWLMLALLIVSALVGINGVVAAVGVARIASLGADLKKWPSPELVADLNVTSSIVVSVTLMFSAILMLALRTKAAVARERTSDRRVEPWRMTRALAFGGRIHAASLGAVILGGAVAMTLQLRFHRATPAASWWIDNFGTTFVSEIAWVTGLVSAFAVVLIIASVVKNMPAWAARGLLYLSVTGSTFMFVLFALVVTRGWGQGLTALVEEKGAYRWMWAWPLLAMVTWQIRGLLVQYVGDVAAYVTPHKLDKFQQLRDAIKDCVIKTARAIYAASPDGKTPEYATVTVVAHSLGSVVAYDTLNRLLNDDGAAGGRYSVAKRTAGLLTFGSPLDKIAYIFSLRRNSEAADAMAASVQPMLLGHGERPVRSFQWVNIWAPDDIISGHLDYFHGNDEPKVVNLRDEHASIPLVAHTEYWSNELVWTKLKEMIAGRTIAADVVAPERSRQPA